MAWTSEESRAATVDTPGHGRDKHQPFPEGLCLGAMSFWKIGVIILSTFWESLEMLFQMFL